MTGDLTSLRRVRLRRFGLAQLMLPQDAHLRVIRSAGNRPCHSLVVYRTETEDNLPRCDAFPINCWDMMDFYKGHVGRALAICDLFTATFSASEGPGEGANIGAFVSDLMATTPDSDLVVCTAYDDAALVGCICFSRLVYAQDARVVFILSPVAVKTDRQKTGIGQKLIAYGLDALREKGVDYVTTYGDPSYYAKVGFRQMTEDFAQAPLRLSYPKGWLGKSLTGPDDQPLIGPSRCVRALDKPDLW